MTLVLIRHHQSLDDVNGLVTGGPFQVDLVDYFEYEKLKEDLQIFMRKNEIDSIYCANNNRSLETARRMVDMNTKIIESDLLNNISQPEWRGLSKAQIIETDLYFRWHNDPESVRFSNGEDLNDVKERVRIFLEDKFFSSEVYVCISHTTWLQVAFCYLLNLPLNKIWSFYFEYGKFSVVKNGVLFMHNCESLSKHTGIIY